MKLIDSIKKHEGYVSTVYKDSVGIDTIGYGFTIKDLVLDQDICEMILQRKLDKLQKDVSTKFGWYNYMPQQIKDVILEMCYQMGVYGFSCFKKTIAYLQDKQWEKASVEMLDSRWYEQTPGRAKKLSDTVKGVD